MSRDPVTGVRGTRLAAGMTATFERQRRIRKPHPNSNHDALKLAVHGTTDSLARSFGAIGKSKCPCCNGTGRSGYHLTDSGALRLRKLRRERAQRSHPHA